MLSSLIIVYYIHSYLIIIIDHKRLKLLISFSIDTYVAKYVKRKFSSFQKLK